MFVPCGAHDTCMCHSLGPHCSDTYKSLNNLTPILWKTWQLYRMLVNSGPSEFGTRPIGEFGAKWIRDQVISGPEVGEFGTNFLWIQDQYFKVFSLQKFHIITFIFQKLKCFICSSISVCLKTCLHIIIGSIKHLLKSCHYHSSLQLQAAAAIKIYCTWSLSIVCLKK